MQFVPRRHVICLIFRAWITRAHYPWYTHHTRSFWHGQPWGGMGVDSEWPPGRKKAIHIYIYIGINTMQFLAKRHVI